MSHITQKSFLAFALAMLMSSVALSAVIDEKKFIGFTDKDKNGINDMFCDADGDGINDINKRKYAHKFVFVDENKDGVNDLWLDKDGDGVNDRLHKLSNGDRRNAGKCIIDVDADGINDITGVKYDRNNFSGQKCGFIDEQSGKVLGKFLDTDGNGIDDRMEAGDGNRRGRQRDLFIDSDGDGICDGRAESLRRQQRYRQNRKGQKN